MIYDVRFMISDFLYRQKDEEYQQILEAVLICLDVLTVELKREVAGQKSVDRVCQHFENLSLNLTLELDLKPLNP